MIGLCSDDNLWPVLTKTTGWVKEDHKAASAVNLCSRPRRGTKSLTSVESMCVTVGVAVFNVLIKAIYQTAGISSSSSIDSQSYYIGILRDPPSMKISTKVYYEKKIKGTKVATQHFYIMVQCTCMWSLSTSFTIRLYWCMNMLKVYAWMTYCYIIWLYMQFSH